jgi:hypothetical protein
MSEEHYDIARAVVRAAGDGDDDLAMLFTSSGWTQERIAAKERMTVAQVRALVPQWPTAPRRPLIGKPIREQFGDGHWHSLSEIVTAITAKFETDSDHVRYTLDGMVETGNYRVRAERKTVGTELHYRLFKATKIVSSAELTAKLGPYVKELEVEGRKSQSMVSATNIARIAGQLRKLLADWGE